MKCFYHTDMDGKCAAAIVRQVKGEGEYIPINYNHVFPFGQINPGEEIFIVDFSLQKAGDFERLFAITQNLVWIDHHKTAIERHREMDQVLAGIRRIGPSGCELTWEYFHPNDPVPRVVTLLGDYDTWTFKYGEETNQLQTGIRLRDNDPEALSWAFWLAPDFVPAVMIAEGRIALLYRDNMYKSQIKSWAFVTEFENLMALACNIGSVSSQLFDSVKETFDLFMPFVWDGEQWTVSLYTKRDDIDVSEIAKIYGGGGHKQAAGFQCQELPFTSIKKYEQSKRI